MERYHSNTEKIIEQIGQKFVSVTGQSISFIDSRGQWKGPLKLDLFTEFCHCVICTEEGKRLCSQCNQVFDKTENGRIDVGQCHMGVTLVSVPVTIEKANLIISYGQFLRENTQRAFWEQLPENCRSLGLDLEHMRRLARAFPVLSEQELTERIELLRLFSNYASVAENEMQARNQYYREVQQKQELENRLSQQSLKSQIGPDFLLRSLERIAQEAEQEQAEHTAQLLTNLRCILMLNNELEKQPSSTTIAKETAQALTQELEQFRAKLSHQMPCASEVEHMENRSNAAVMQAVRILQSRYAEDLSLPRIANELFLAPGYLSRIFKRETGKNFKEYLTEIRMDHARQLLEAGNLSVGEVACRVGYQDASYFARVYKRQFGETPRQKSPNRLKKSGI